MGLFSSVLHFVPREKRNTVSTLSDTFASDACGTETDRATGIEKWMVKMFSVTFRRAPRWTMATIWLYGKMAVEFPTDAHEVEMHINCVGGMWSV